MSFWDNIFQEEDDELREQEEDNEVNRILFQIIILFFSCILPIEIVLYSSLIVKKLCSNQTTMGKYLSKMP
jgi:hypothetical protein